MQISQIKSECILKKKTLHPPCVYNNVRRQDTAATSPKSVSHTHASDSVSILVRYSYDRIRVMFNLTKKKKSKRKKYTDQMIIKQSAFQKRKRSNSSRFELFFKKQQPCISLRGSVMSSPSMCRCVSLFKTTKHPIRSRFENKQKNPRGTRSVACLGLSRVH